MNRSSTEDILNENSKLENKVVLALSRLQKDQKYVNRKGKFAGIGSKQLVEYLSSNYCSLDGDIETQVITALMTGIKNGIICALDNGKYQLASISKTMPANCQKRFSHGPKCSCINTISRMPNAVSKICCYSKGSRKSKAGKRIKKCTRLKSTPTQKLRATRKTKPDKDKKKPWGPSVSSSASFSNKTKKVKCDYCLDFHPVPKPSSPENSKKKCKCENWPRTRYGVPYDKFSPREESAAFKYT